MSTPSPASDDARAAAVQRLVRDLEHNFRDAVQRAMRFSLDGSVASLAIVDHYLAMAREETRAPILALLAAGAGAYFGELVRNHLGAQWIGDASDPRHLRLLLTPEFAYFSPADLAFAAILGDEPGPDDPRTPMGVPLDTAIHLRSSIAPLPNPRRVDDPADPPPDPPEDGEPAPTSAPTPSADDDVDDQAFIAARLGELSPVPTDEFYSLTTRYETLELILQMLASRRAQAGYEPYTYTINDYLHAFS